MNLLLDVFKLGWRGGSIWLFLGGEAPEGEQNDAER
jgi:hypothetical protein